jgi:hypothetical protein
MPIATKNSLPGESPGDKLSRIAQSYAGCSLQHDRERLGRLVARGVDDPESVVTIHTNCGMFALGVMAEAGVQHEILDRKYQTGEAIAWLRLIGKALGALVTYRGPHGPQPKHGSLLRYNTAGHNDDHVEWLIGTIDSSGHAAHCGGGRPDNAITIVPGNLGEKSLVTWNYGRPLVEFWDPDLLGIEVVPLGSDINEAFPDERT